MLNGRDLHRLKQLDDEITSRKNEIWHTFKPYAKQADFFALGKYYNERAFMAANQSGKTLAAAFETVCHLTGIYTEDWEGARFKKPTVIWSSGESFELITKTSQKILFGRPEELETQGEYTGILPKRLIMSFKKAVSGGGGFEYVKIKHITGKASYVFFKPYSQGAAKFQGDTIDAVWLDEEPPLAIYDEALTRTSNGQLGRFGYTTFTPLLGLSDVVLKFWENPTPNQVLIRMELEEVDHYTKEQKEIMVAGYEPYIREARSQGKPALGSGRVFKLSESDISEPRIEKIPDHWSQLGALDFGYGDHPTAAVHLLHDPETDVVHLRAALKDSCLPVLFAASVKPWGDLLYTYPHDGNNQDRGNTGEIIRDHYEKSGMRLTHICASFKDETRSIAVEPGIMEMDERMKTNRFKVDESLEDWFREFRLYHRKNGIINKKNDDLLDATRHGIMMLRFFEKVKRYKNDAVERIII